LFQEFNISITTVAMDRALFNQAHNST